MACIDRKCTSCNEVRPISNFYKRNNRSNGLQHHCKTCQNIRTSADKVRKREYDKHYYRMRNYGISYSEYEQMVESQKGLCAICNKECTRHKSLSIDHCHLNNKVRGLLCHKCNNAIGLFNEDRVIMQSAIRYLEAHS